MKTTRLMGLIVVAAAVAACASDANDPASALEQAATGTTGASGDDVAIINEAAGGNGNGNGNGNGRISLLEFANPSGTLRTYTDNAKTTLKPNKSQNIAFFQSLGTNGRACVHCHMPANGWGLAARDVQYRFTHPLDLTNMDCLESAQSCPQDKNPQNYGLTDPIFRTVDGAVSPLADVSTPQARQAAYSMLLRKGLIRVGIGIPANAEFTLVAVDDPYHYASAKELSLFRRPLPSTNLRLSPTSSNPSPMPVLNAVMWDGRETLPGRDIIADLMDQAQGATLGHAQAIAGLSATDLQSIVDFETGLHTAQSTDAIAGPLDQNGGNGGPQWLSVNQPYYNGINDAVAGDAVTHAPFTPNVFTIYTAWQNATDAAQAAIARGQAIFDGKPIGISGVTGLNDALGIASLAGGCTTCHDAPNYGHHSVKLPIDIGLVGPDRRTSDLPLYTLQNITTGETRQVTDPGRALITGKWADIGKFKGPLLRGLAARAPYFHNGSAATLADVVAFYDARFRIGFTEQEKSDLVAFLNAL